MEFKLVSKNNIGLVVALLLVVLLSQSQFFNFLLDTALGRSVLIFLVLILAYVNKILGVVAVLFIIILFNQSDLGYLEGSTAPSQKTTTTANKEEENQKIKQNVKTNMASKAAASAAPAPAPAPAPTPTTTNPASSLTTAGAEGFDLIGTENNIKRGKQSNKIPVSEHMRESMSVSAFDGSFSDSYSAF